MAVSVGTTAIVDIIAPTLRAVEGGWHWWVGPAHRARGEKMKKMTYHMTEPKEWPSLWDRQAMLGLTWWYERVMGKSRKTEDKSFALGHRFSAGAEVTCVTCPQI